MKTKSNVKILLLVAILLISMCIFNISYAQTTEGITKNLEDITQEEFNSIIPSSIDVNTTKTDYINSYIEYDKKINAGQEVNFDDKVLEEVKTKIIAIIESNNYTISNNIDISVTNELVGGGNDFENAIIGIFENEKNLCIKTTKVNFKQESNYNATDENYVKNAVKNIKFAKFEGEDAVFTMYNIGDEENANKWTPNTYDFSKLVADSSIQIKTTGASGGMGGATPWGIGNRVYFYKNNVLYVTKYVWNLGAYGTTLDNGTPINMAKLDKEYDKEIYAEMEKELNNRGLTNILGAYELTAYGTTSNSMNISFTIGTQYNGKEIQILHRKNDNTYEIFKTEVKDGKATIQVSELSPFMIALANTTQTQETPKEEIPNKKLDNEPKTGVENYVVLASVVALISLSGIVILKIKK